MSNWSGSPWSGSQSGWYTPPGRTSDGAMRVGDAERQAVADSLSEHYGAGRLDPDEFNERIGRAMGAKTRADLSGLLTDLPRPAPPIQVEGKHLRVRSRIFAFLLVAFVVASTVGVWLQPHIHLFTFFLIFFAIWFFTRRRRRWRRVPPHTHGQPGTQGSHGPPHTHGASGHGICPACIVESVTRRL